MQPVKFTRQQTRVAACLVRGLSNKEIAGELGISEYTAKFHVASVCKKLGVTERTKAAVMCARMADPATVTSDARLSFHIPGIDVEIALADNDVGIAEIAASAPDQAIVSIAGQLREWLAIADAELARRGFVWKDDVAAGGEPPETFS